MLSFNSIFLLFLIDVLPCFPMINHNTFCSNKKGEAREKRKNGEMKRRKSIHHL